jgi:long-chain acyl-CoA synthetase
VPDAKSGEAVMLFVVPKDASVSTDQVMAYCKTQLAGYKTPRVIQLRDALPKTNVGKILRRQLRDEVMQVKAEAKPEVKAAS